MSKVIIVFLLAVVFAAVPFFIGAGKVYLDNVHISGSELITLNLGDMLIAGVTVALSAILSSIDANEQITSATNVFISSILSGITGLACLVAYAIFAIGIQKIQQNASDFTVLRDVGCIIVSVTLLVSFTCYVIVYKARESIV
jgi:hypothetical protein